MVTDAGTVTNGHGNGSPAGPTSGTAGDRLKKLETELNQLSAQGYQLYITPQDDLPMPANLPDLMSQMDGGRSVGVSRPGSDHVWPIESARKFEEFVFSESGNVKELPRDTRRQLRLLGRLKRDGGVKFYSRAQNNRSIALKMGPIWLLEKGSLYASVKGEEKQKVESLEDLAQSLGIDPAAPPKGKGQPPMLTLNGLLVKGEVDKNQAQPPMTEWTGQPDQEVKGN